MAHERVSALLGMSPGFFGMQLEFNLGWVRCHLSDFLCLWFVLFMHRLKLIILQKTAISQGRKSISSEQKSCFIFVRPVGARKIP